MFKNKAGKNA